MGPGPVWSDLAAEPHLGPYSASPDRNRDLSIGGGGSDITNSLVDRRGLGPGRGPDSDVACLRIERIDLDSEDLPDPDEGQRGRQATRMI
jgi:hypothetical protein